MKTLNINLNVPQADWVCDDDIRALVYALAAKVQEAMHAKPIVVVETEELEERYDFNEVHHANA